MEENVNGYLVGDGDYQKVYNLAVKGEGGEKENAIRILQNYGIFIDKAGIPWPRVELFGMSKEKSNFLFGQGYLEKYLSDYNPLKEKE